MTEIVNGQFITNELSVRSNGGTEQMARRMVSSIPQDLFQGIQIIHSRVRNLIPGLKKILVCHDLPNDPEVQKLADPEYRKQFDKIVFVSNWQAQMYNAMLQIPYSEFVVIRNAIEPFFNEKINETPAVVNFIYHTTPHRGLDIAYHVIDNISKKYSVHFDVFSSFSVYGWEMRDRPYDILFEAIRDHKSMTYHGGVDNDVIRQALSKKDMHFFLYPSTWMETSCIAAIESMCAGVIPIVPNLAALAETCHGIGPIMYQFHPDKIKHIEICTNTVEQAIRSISDTRHQANQMLNWSNQYYDWNNVVKQWEILLKDTQNG